MAKYIIEKEKFEIKAFISHLRNSIDKDLTVSLKGKNVLIESSYVKKYIYIKEKNGEIIVKPGWMSWKFSGLFLYIILLCFLIIPGEIFRISTTKGLKRVNQVLPDFFL